MYTILLPLGVNPIVVKKYIYIYLILVYALYKFGLGGWYLENYFLTCTHPFSSSSQTTLGNSQFVEGLQSFAVDKLLLKIAITFSFPYSLFFTKLFILCSVLFPFSGLWKKIFNWCRASVGLRKWTYRLLVADPCLVLLEWWNQGEFGQNT
jgi:hypothetical protein